MTTADKSKPARIVVTFPAAGSSEPSVEAENVTPNQVYLAAKILEYVAQEVRVDQKMQETITRMQDPQKPLVTRDLSMIREIQGGRNGR